MEQRTISILGSTGSIGRQTLEVAEKLGLGIAALSAGSNIGLLEEQARRFRPALVAVYDVDAARLLTTQLGDTPTRVVSGPDGLIEAAAIAQADTVVTAVVGTVGLLPTLAAIDAGKRIALANKETLVCAGELVMRRAEENGADIVPVDSEHSAIFQCLGANRHSAYKKIILTASGGPFRGRAADDIYNMTKAEALRHPNWSMGAKITVDSATLMNKGLEYIEAMHLFSAAPSQIEIVVHPESIVHSMVEFDDNSIIAQLSVPDMRLPIQYALTFPDRLPSLTAPLDLTAAGSLTFHQPDTDTFTCLQMALTAAKKGGTACAVLNAANEAAVGLFLDDKIRFGEIGECVAGAMDTIKNSQRPSIDDILAADAAAREFVFGHYR